MNVLSKNFLSILFLPILFLSFFPYKCHSAIIPQIGWSLHYVDSEELVGEDGAAVNSFDGNVNTLWHTEWYASAPPHPHEIQIDLGGVYDIDGFRYLPRQDGGVNGRIAQYEFYISTDGSDWGTAVATGTFANDAIEKDVTFSPVTGQFVRLRALSEVNGNPWTSVAEISVLGEISAGNQPPNGVIDTPTGDVTITVGESIDFSGTGSDPDGDYTLSFLWEFGVGSGILDSTQEDPGLKQFDNVGTLTVTFTATDAEGLADPTPATRIITVTENQPPNGVIDTPVSDVTITVGQSIDFSGTGIDPDDDYPLSFLWEFGEGSGILDSTDEDPGLKQFDNVGTFTVTFTVTDAEGLSDPIPATCIITIQSAVIPQTNWSLHYVDSEELVGEDGAAVNSFDGNVNTLWHTEWYASAPPHPHEIQIDLGGVYDIDGFMYLPRQDGGVNGRIAQYEFYISTDGSDWGTAVATGTFANDAIEKDVTFSPVTGQFVRLRALSEVNGNPWTTMAELNLLGEISLENQSPTANDDTSSTNEDTAVTIDVVSNDTDIDGTIDVSTVSIVTDAGNGTTVVNGDGTITYTPVFGFTGTDIFTYTVNDNDGATSNEATVTITVSAGINQAPNGVIDTPTGDVTITVGESIDFSGTGIDPDDDYPLSFLWEFGEGSGILDSTDEDPGLKQFDNVGTFTVTFTVTDAEGLSDPTPATCIITVQSAVIPQTSWSLHYVDSEELDGEDGAAVNSFDGNVNTLWHTEWYASDPPYPHEIQIDLGGVYDIDGFRYLPRQDGGVNGRIAQYEFYISTDGSDWGVSVATGTFANDATEKEVTFSSVTGQFIRLQALSEVNGNPWTSMAELNLLGEISLENQPPTANDDTSSTNEDTAVTIDVVSNDTDIDGTIDVSSVSIVTDAGNGTTVVNGDGTITYTPVFGFTGTDIFTYTVNDNEGATSNEATVTITVSAGINQPPNGVIDTPVGDVTITVGQSVDFLGTGSDPDGDYPLSFLWEFGEGSGILDSTDEDPGLKQFDNVGTFTATFTVTDAKGLSDPTPATRIITVQSAVIPQTSWSLHYVDSEELVGEDGAAVNAFDNNVNTLWHTEWYASAPPHPHEIQIDLGGVYDIDGFRYLPRQDGSPNGNIDQYEFYISTDGSDWGTAVATGTFANDAIEKEVTFSPVTGQFIRLRALSEVNGNLWTSVAEISVLGEISAGNQAPNGVIDTPTGDVTITVGEIIDFLGTGSDPDGDYPLSFLWEFGEGSGILDSTDEDPGLKQFDNVGTFTATFTVTDAKGLSDPTPATRIITVQSAVIPQTSWSLHYVDSEELVGEDGAAVNAFDNNVNTLWHTEWYASAPPHPHEIQIDLGGVYDIDGFRYLPRQDGSPNGNIDQYEFYISTDGSDWGTAVATGTFANDAIEKEVTFSPVTGQFIRLRALSEVNGNPWTSMAELNLLGQCVVPSVIILEPESNHLQTSSDLYVLVNAYLAGGQGVKILLDGGLQSIEDYSYPYEITFEGVSLSEHTVDAFVIDENSEEVIGIWTHYNVTNVGIGDYYVAMGDSITDGECDDDESDDISNDGRNSGGGYEPILNNLLTAALGYPHTIINEGVGGTVSFDGASSIHTLLEKHPDAQRFLVQYGTNDAWPWLPVPSGLGLEPGNDGYPGTFKDNTQQIINAINADGRETCLAKAPIALGDCFDPFICVPYIDPDNGPRSVMIKEYNEVVDELFNEPTNYINIIPPDFYSYFNYYDPQAEIYRYEVEYSDNLHPSGQGYRSMAEQWFEALY